MSGSVYTLYRDSLERQQDDEKIKKELAKPENKGKQKHAVILNWMKKEIHNTNTSETYFQYYTNLLDEQKKLDSDTTASQRLAVHRKSYDTPVDRFFDKVMVHRSGGGGYVSKESISATPKPSEEPPKPPASVPPWPGTFLQRFARSVSKSVAPPDEAASAGGVDDVTADDPTLVHTHPTAAAGVAGTAADAAAQPTSAVEYHSEDEEIYYEAPEDDMSTRISLEDHVSNSTSSSPSLSHIHTPLVAGNPETDDIDGDVHDFDIPEPHVGGVHGSDEGPLLADVAETDGSAGSSDLLSGFNLQCTRGTPQECVMSQRTALVAMTSLVIGYTPDIADIIGDASVDSDVQTLKRLCLLDDADDPRVASTFYKNYTTLVLYNTATRRILCELTCAADEKQMDPPLKYENRAISYTTSPFSVKETFPSIRHELCWTDTTNGMGTWTLHDYVPGSPDRSDDIVLTSNTSEFKSPRECIFPGFTCRYAFDVAPFQIHTEPASDQPFCGEYNAQVEDIADDVYYHTDYDTQKQYKCFKNDAYWFIAEFDSVGGYQEICRSTTQWTSPTRPTSSRVAVAAPPAHHPRLVEAWTSNGTDARIAARIHYAPKAQPRMLTMSRSTAGYGRRVDLDDVSDTDKRLHFIYKYEDVEYTGQVQVAEGQQGFPYASWPSTAQPDDTENIVFTKTRENHWPLIPFVDTLQLIECDQTVVVFDLNTKTITCRMSWDETQNEFTSEIDIDNPVVDPFQMRFTPDYTWRLSSRDHFLETMHRHLPVVGRGFFLAPQDGNTPTHYCTHARNVDAFFFEGRRYSPMIAGRINVAETWYSQDGHLASKALDHDTTSWWRWEIAHHRTPTQNSLFRWEIALDRKQTHLSDAFQRTDAAFMHPIYADFHMIGVAVPLLEAPAALVCAELRGMAGDIADLDKQIKQKKSQGVETEKLEGDLEERQTKFRTLQSTAAAECVNVVRNNLQIVQHLRLPDNEHPIFPLAYSLETDVLRRAALTTLMHSQQAWRQEIYSDYLSDNPVMGRQALQRHRATARVAELGHDTAEDAAAVLRLEQTRLKTEIAAQRDAQSRDTTPALESRSHNQQAFIDITKRAEAATREIELRALELKHALDGVHLIQENVLRDVSRYEKKLLSDVDDITNYVDTRLRRLDDVVTGAEAERDAMVGQLQDSVDLTRENALVSTHHAAIAEEEANHAMSHRVRAAGASVATKDYRNAAVQDAEAAELARGRADRAAGAAEGQRDRAAGAADATEGHNGRAGSAAVLALTAANKASEDTKAIAEHLTTAKADSEHIQKLRGEVEAAAAAVSKANTNRFENLQAIETATAAAEAREQSRGQQVNALVEQLEAAIAKQAKERAATTHDAARVQEVRENVRQARVAVQDAERLSKEAADADTRHAQELQAQKVALTTVQAQVTADLALVSQQYAAYEQQANLRYHQYEQVVRTHIHAQNDEIQRLGASGPSGMLVDRNDADQHNRDNVLRQEISSLRTEMESAILRLDISMSEQQRIVGREGSNNLDNIRSDVVVLQNQVAAMTFSNSTDLSQTRSELQVMQGRLAQVLQAPSQEATTLDSVRNLITQIDAIAARVDQLETNARQLHATNALAIAAGVQVAAVPVDSRVAASSEATRLATEARTRADLADTRNAITVFANAAVQDAVVAFIGGTVEDLMAQIGDIRMNIRAQSRNTDLRTQQIARFADELAGMTVVVNDDKELLEQVVKAFSMLHAASTPDQPQLPDSIVQEIMTAITTALRSRGTPRKFAVATLLLALGALDNFEAISSVNPGLPAPSGQMSMIPHVAPGNEFSSPRTANKRRSTEIASDDEILPAATGNSSSLVTLESDPVDGNSLAIVSVNTSGTADSPRPVKISSHNGSFFSRTSQTIGQGFSNVVSGIAALTSMVNGSSVAAGAGPEEGDEPDEWGILLKDTDIDEVDTLPSLDDVGRTNLDDVDAEQDSSEDELIHDIDKSTQARGWRKKASKLQKEIEALRRDNGMPNPRIPAMQQRLTDSLENAEDIERDLMRNQSGALEAASRPPAPTQPRVLESSFKHKYYLKWVDDVDKTIAEIKEEEKKPNDRNKTRRLNKLQEQLKAQKNTMRENASYAGVSRQQQIDDLASRAAARQPVGPVTFSTSPQTPPMPVAGVRPVQPAVVVPGAGPRKKDGSLDGRYAVNKGRDQ